MIKLFECIMESKVSTWVRKIVRGLTYKFDFHIRGLTYKQHTTTLRVLMEERCLRGKGSYSGFTDLKKAFNIAPHEHL